ncbi:MAG: hypothetical protein RLZZ253_1816 [Verrucomicrobiota bacterium]
MNPRPDRMFLLNGDEDSLKEEHADLFRAERAVGLQVDHLGDNEEMIGVRFDLGPLTDMEHVLKGEGVELEFFAEAFERFHVAEAAHVQPPDLSLGGCVCEQI